MKNKDGIIHYERENNLPPKAFAFSNKDEYLRWLINHNYDQADDVPKAGSPTELEDWQEINGRNVSWMTFEFDEAGEEFRDIQWNFSSVAAVREAGRELGWVRELGEIKIAEHWDAGAHLTGGSSAKDEYDAWLKFALGSPDWFGDEFTLDDFHDYISELEEQEVAK